MFRQPTTEEYNYLLPYIQGAENSLRNKVHSNLNLYITFCLILAIVGVLLFLFVPILSIFLWMVAGSLFFCINLTKGQANKQFNTSMNFSFDIMDCTLLEIYYKKNNPNMPQQINSLNIPEPMGNVLMSNGNKIPGFFIQTQESITREINNFYNNYSYNVPAYYIRTSNNVRNYIIVKP